MVEVLLLVFTVAITSVGLRSSLIRLHSKEWRRGWSGDSSVHITLIRHIEAGRASKPVPAYVIGSRAPSYPLLFHRFAALFGSRLIVAKPWLPNAVLFTVFSTFAVGISAAWLQSNGQLTIATAAVLIAAVLIPISGVWIFGPAIAYIGLSERLLGRLATGLSQLLLLLAINTENVAFVLCSALWAAVAMLASKFARQAIWLSAPILAGLVLSVYPLMGAIIGTALAVLIDKRRFFASICFQVQHLRAYSGTIRKSPVASRALATYLEISDLRPPWSAKGLLALAISKEPSRLVVFFPEVLLAGALTFSWSDPPGSNAAAFIVTFLIIYVATSIRRFSFLGESYRYVEFGLVYITPIALAEASLQFAWVLPFLLVVGCFGILVAIFHQRRLNGALSETDELSEFLSSLPLREGDLIFPISMRLGADVTARLPVRSYWWQPGNITSDILNKYVDNYPFLSSKVLHAAREEVDYIILRLSALRQYTGDYELWRFECIAEVGDLACYRVSAWPSV